jgi:LysR family transcriptional regulator, carnitine catabolism transcriptional activator
MRAPSLRQLRGFQAVAQHANFSRAADALALSQPALSAAIRELEQMLGVALFERSTHHVALTPTGARMRAQLEWLVNSYEHGVSDLRRVLDGQALSLRVAALPSAMHLLVGPLAQWQRLHPEVQLSVYDPLNDELVTGVHRGDIDIGLGVDMDLPSGIDTVTVVADEMVAVLPATHPLALRDHLNWRDLAGQRLALFARGSTYELSLATLRQKGVALDDAMQMQYSESLYSLVASGLAVGLISRLYTQNLHSAAVVVRTLHVPRIARRVALMVRNAPGQRRAAVENAFAYLSKALID